MRNSSLAGCWWFGILLIAASRVTADEPAAPARDSQASKPPSEQEIKQWVRQLGDDKVAVRDAATEALRDAGLPAVLLVRQAKYNGGLEVRNRAERILLHIEQQARKEVSKFGGHTSRVIDGHVTSLSFGGTKNVRKIVPHIVAFTQLQYLHLQNSDVTDDDLAQIQDIVWLEELILHDTEISDQGLSHIRLMANLQRLDLGGCSIVGSGLQQIATLPTLNNLNLGDTPLSGDELSHLKEMRSLAELGLSRTQIADGAMRHLVEIPNLKAVTLMGADVSDAGVKELIRCKKLTWLNLACTRITDKGLVLLANMKQLQHLIMHGTSVTVDGIERVLAPRNLKVIWVPSEIGAENIATLRRSFTFMKGEAGIHIADSSKHVCAPLKKKGD